MLSVITEHWLEMEEKLSPCVRDLLLTAFIAFMRLWAFLKVPLSFHLFFF